MTPSRPRTTRRRRLLLRLPLAACGGGFSFERQTMNNPEFWTKLGKAVIAVGTVVGIQIDPAHLAEIYQGAMGLLAVLYTIDSWRKSRKG